ncbi:hypothetical protein FRB99_001244 [Tulasnella sp. 403]|nr:hypothetical protein FRB99_001244 [Tulasnella sp. 403]
MPPPVSIPNSFNTLSREDSFRHPSKDGSTVPKIKELVAPTIESFDALFDELQWDSVGLLQAGLKNMPEVVLFDHVGKDGQDIGKGMGNRLSLRISAIMLGKPMASSKDQVVVERRIFPTEARERMITYKGKLQVKITWQVNQGVVAEEIRDCGSVPIMVGSIRCNLRGFSSAKLVSKHEEAEEFGGYFIVNGIERLIRYTIVQRRNYPLAISRTSFTKRGPTYTRLGVSIRCVRSDETSQTNTLHYCSDGSVMFRFHYMRREYLIPVMLILKAFFGASDKEIFQGVVMKDFADSFLCDRMESLLRGFKEYKLHTSDQCLQFLGEKFRKPLELPEDYTDVQLGTKLLEMVVLVHLGSPRDKYNMLIFMLRKLMALASGKCVAENADSPANQEILMPGTLYASIILEQCYEALLAVKAAFLKDLGRGGGSNFTGSMLFLNQMILPFTPITSDKYILQIIHNTRISIADKLLYFLSTGTIPTRSGLDLQQVSGYTIVAEKLNWYRYFSHFRSVHRGSSFQDMGTTTVRKLLPEAWGFLCPVHTPDGTPCGLLNHLARECRLVTQKVPTGHIPGLLSPLGMLGPSAESLDGRKDHCIQLDGRIIGWAGVDICQGLAVTLRTWKTEGHNSIPFDLEIALVPPSNGGQYPGLYLFSGRARMMRTVRYLANGKDDSIGSFEQVYMDIAVKPEDISSDNFTHVELNPTNFLSVLASLTPFSDYNQSPRNIYQCQMAKQTMGTASTALMHRTDTKSYRLLTPQTPIVRPEAHNTYGMDCFPNGTNAVVAVISYTGYDMEDAMIINKSAHERGFGQGYIYKTIVVDLRKEKGGFASGPPTNHFGIGSDVSPDHPARGELTSDGLPTFQIRTTGPIDQATRQPVKGRKHGGGIRFGEMERDALLAHGTSFLLQDRLMNCSDYSTAWVCRTCGSLISIGYEDNKYGEVIFGRDTFKVSLNQDGLHCRVCRAEAEDEAKKERKDLAGGIPVPKKLSSDIRITLPPENVFGRTTKGEHMAIVAVPFVFRYLCAELAAMGIKVSLECS